VIESQNYFEAYRHNLLALQRFTSNNFPLEEYIIRVSKEILKPSYIKQNTVYDLSHMILTVDASDQMLAEVQNRDTTRSKKLYPYKSVKILLKYC
jgi:helicase required for RNAi-mediated heterochromatin assembly 1